tara:strand:- start:40 stop:495 length:456 start_codon:yes stop_codon:yes gene_type:complete
MASRREYTYQIKGNKLSLLEKDYSTSSGLGLAGVSTDGTQYGTSGDGITDDIPSGTTVIRSPLLSVTNGIEIEYAYSHNINLLNDESDTIDLPSYLSKALVYYVKAKVAEDQMNIEVKEYMMREFRRMVEKHESSKVAGPRMIMPGPNALR